jgi:flagellar biosynthesis protein FliR
VFDIPLRPILIFAIVLARVGGLATFAPFWGNRALPGRIRAMLALALALALTPTVLPRMATPPSDALGLSMVLLGECVIGCAFGLVGRLIFSALDMVAYMLGFQLGLMLASTIDPSTRAQTNAIGAAMQMFGLMILLAIDGHHWFLITTVRSFDVLGPGGASITADLARLMLRLSADALATGVALAAPSIVILLAVEVLLSIAGRAAQQLQVMMLSFPLKILFGVWVVGSALYFMPGALRSVLGSIRANLARALGAM